MTVDFFLLFLAVTLFAMVNSYINKRAENDMLKLLTLFYIYCSLVTQFVMLIITITYLK